MKIEKKPDFPRNKCIVIKRKEHDHTSHEQCA
jgi:hypothetical protein